MTDAAVRVVVAACIAVTLALAAWGGWRWVDGVIAERDALRDYKAGVEQRERVSAAASAAYEEGLAAGRAQALEADRQVGRHAAAKQEARDEDPRVDEWLGTAVPDGLRRADAAARAAGGLGQGGAGDR